MACRAGTISAAELQEYFARIVGSDNTGELLESIAELLPVGHQQASLLAVTQGAAKIEETTDNWTRLNLDTASVDQSQLEQPVQAAQEAELRLKKAMAAEDLHSRPGSNK